MAYLKLNVTGQLNNLIPVSGNTYRFIVKYYNTSDVLLPNTQLIQNSEIITPLTTNTFNLRFPVEDGTYSINNVKVKLFNNSSTSECFAEFITNINVNCNGSSGACSPSVLLTGIPTQTCSGTNVLINGNSLISTGGTSPYQYAIVKTTDFTNVGALTWDTTKSWTVLPNTAYRIYTRGTSTVNDSTCYSFISLTSINCEATTCSPSVSISGTPTQSCFDATHTTINGSSLSGTGGNNTYLYGIIKASDFTNISDVTFSTTKTWNVIHNQTYRIYIKDSSGINHSSCYAYITIVAQDCTGNNCTSGPDLLSIDNITQTGLRFNFNGTDVFGIAWDILQFGSVVRTGNVTPTNAFPTITYPSLPSGSYTLRIQGSTCVSTPDTLDFVIPNISLAFVSGSPSISGSGSNFIVSITLNLSGSYNTIITNTDTSTVYKNDFVNYTANIPYTLGSLPVGHYSIQVNNTLFATLTAADPISGVTYVNGKKITVQGGLTYESIDGETTRFIVLPSGNVKLELLETKPSFNGASTTGAIVLNDELNDWDSTELTNAKSLTGIAVQSGDHFIADIYYLKISLGNNVAAIDAHIYDGFNDASRYAGNSARCDTAMITIY